MRKNKLKAHTHLTTLLNGQWVGICPPKEKVSLYFSDTVAVSSAYASLTRHLDLFNRCCTLSQLTITNVCSDAA